MCLCEHTNELSESSANNIFAVVVPMRLSCSFDSAVFVHKLNCCFLFYLISLIFPFHPSFACFSFGYKKVKVESRASEKSCVR